jgi:Tol biopolymer transport system component
LADPTDSAILTRNGGGANLAWSPDSSAVAFTDLDIAGVMNLYLYDLESQMTLQLSDIATTADEIRSIAWSPDSDRVSFVVQNDVLFTLRIIEVDGARAQPEPIVGQSEITDHWWVDGETILYWAGSYFTSSGTGRSALYRIRLPSGEPQFVISRGSTPEKIFDNPHLIEGTNLVGFMGLTSFFTLDLDSGEIHQHFELDGPGSSWSALPLGASAPKSCDSTQVSP